MAEKQELNCIKGGSGVIKARILKWFAIPFSNGLRFLAHALWHMDK